MKKALMTHVESSYSDVKSVRLARCFTSIILYVISCLNDNFQKFLKKPLTIEKIMIYYYDLVSCQMGGLGKYNFGGKQNA